MPEKSPKFHRIPSRRRIRPPNPIRFPTPVRRAKAARNPGRILSRSASEPILCTLRFVSPSTELISRDGDWTRSGIGEQQLFLPRPHTLTDVLSPSSFLFLSSPSSPQPNFTEEAKVVVSVTVEGSPGPVRAMVKLGGTVDEAIGVVVDKYRREGRSPRLDRNNTNSFQLHHSHFSLQSLNKGDKIGEVGGRSFYLRKSSDSNSFSFGSDGRELTGGREIDLLDGRLNAVPHPTHLFFSCIAKRLSKIKRRTRKIWRVVACITCG